MDNLEFRWIRMEEIDSVIDIFHQDNLKYASGEYPEKEWISQFIKYGYAYGIYSQGVMKAALVAESLLAGGVNLWLIATRPEDIGKGYGQELLTHFETEMKLRGKHWIFLTSWHKSSSFYLRNGFLTSGLNVKEYCKSLRD